MWYLVVSKTVAKINEKKFQNSFYKMCCSLYRNEKIQQLLFKLLETLNPSECLWEVFSVIENLHSKSPELSFQYRKLFIVSVDFHLKSKKLFIAWKKNFLRVFTNLIKSKEEIKDSLLSLSNHEKIFFSLSTNTFTHQTFLRLIVKTIIDLKMS